MIRFQEVSKIYRAPAGGDEIRALDRLTLSVGDGEFVAVRGPSGSGKSTLLALVAGLDTPSSGEVVTLGQSLTGMSSRQRAAFRRENIGFVFQMFHLLPYLSVLDNVRVAARSNGAASGRARQLLERFGLADRLRQPAGQLSAGERQRVALARALVNGPRLILADEPTGNLDAENAASVLTMLREIHAAGSGILLVTHDPQAAAVAERTIELRNGQLGQLDQVAALGQEGT